MRIAIFGTGGIGGYFGGRLASAGEDVVFLARGEHLRAIRENGLHIESDKGDVVISPAQATDVPADIGVVDAILVGVKAWQVEEVAQAMHPLIGPDTVVIPLQNGVEASDQLAAVVGAEHVIAGLARIFSFLVGPGKIHQIGQMDAITLGELHNERSTRIEQLCETFTRAGIPTDIATDIHVALWEKLVFVVPLGGIGAVTRAPVGVIRSLPETRQMLEQGMREIIEVAQARHMVLADDLITRILAYTDSQPPSSTASLQRDIMDGRPSELEAWNGAVCRLGQEVGVATPLHAFVYHSLLPLELQARGRVEFPS